MAAEYTSLESVRLSYMGPWQDDWNDWVEDQIPVVSGILRKGFKNYGKNLDIDIANGDVEVPLVRSVANAMLSRRITTFDNGLGGGMDMSDLSATAGSYTFSMTPAGSTGSFYVKREEWKLLGLPSIALGGINYSFLEVPNVPLS